MDTISGEQSFRTEMLRSLVGEAYRNRIKEKSSTLTGYTDEAVTNAQRIAEYLRDNPTITEVEGPDEPNEISFTDPAEFRLALELGYAKIYGVTLETIRADQFIQSQIDETVAHEGDHARILSGHPTVQKVKYRMFFYETETGDVRIRKGVTPYGVDMPSDLIRSSAENPKTVHPMDRHIADSGKRKRHRRR